MANSATSQKKELHPLTKSAFSEVINKQLLANYDEERLILLSKNVHENLNNVLREWGLKKTTLSVICGITKPSVSRWFKGTNWPRMGNIILLSKYIDRNPVSFFKKDGIHLNSPDGGFNIDVYFTTTPDNQMILNANAIKELYEEIGSFTGVNMEKESLESAIAGLGRLSKTEKALIANWRLLTPTSQAFILHNIYLEARYSKNMYKRNEDDVRSVLANCSDSKENAAEAKDTTTTKEEK